MNNKINVGILGATGMVGQTFIKLLHNHLWFEVTYVAASPNSAGLSYAEAVKGRWRMKIDIPDTIKDMIVEDANIVEKAKGKCSLLFSAMQLDTEEVKKLELEYAKNDFAIVSADKAHRHTIDVPVIIPEINHHHLDAIQFQKQRNGFNKGFIVTKPNCSIQSFCTPLDALIKAGFNISKAMITTLEAVSGAGYPGPSSYDMIDNIVPFISGEEEKTEIEPKKIFGIFKDGEFKYNESMTLSAQCTRVPVIDGHTACVSIQFIDKKPDIDQIIGIWNSYSSLPQELNLPSAPQRAIIYREEKDRPQPAKDRDAEDAMAVSVGRLRKCQLFDYKFIGLSHNTIRGAAGGAVLIAELLKAKGYLDYY